MKLFWLWLCVPLFFLGCATAAVNSSPYGKRIYSPTDPQSVRVLREFPDSGYVKIGEVSGELPSYLTFKDTDRTLEEKFRAEAARIGADAVVIREDAPAYQSGNQHTSWNSSTWVDKKGTVRSTGSEDAGQDKIGRRI